MEGWIHLSLHPLCFDLEASRRCDRSANVIKLDLSRQTFVRHKYESQLSGD